jgi:hypothetical protein
MSDREPQRGRLIRWALTLVPAIAVWLMPRPEGITPEAGGCSRSSSPRSWARSRCRCPAAPVVLLAVTAAAATGALPVAEALRGYSIRSSGWCSRRSASRAR